MPRARQEWETREIRSVMVEQAPVAYDLGAEGDVGVRGLRERWPVRHTMNGHES
jgi:hypothetical protein